MARRLIIAAGWLAAAVLAVLVGLVAVSLIGDGLVSPAAKPLSPSDVARELAAEPTSTPSPSLSPSPSPSTSAPSSSAVSRTFRTRAGTVVASCDGDSGSITLMSPGSGFTVHERDGSEGEFRGVSDDHDRVKVDVSCADGRPDLEIESRDD
jgi:hypothetical protein